jgi:MFS family permease
MNFPGLTANYYPVQVRSTGAGWAMAFGRMGSVIGPLAGGALVTMQLDTAQMLELSAIPAVLAAIVLLILARACPERGSRNVNPDR